MMARTDSVLAIVPAWNESQAIGPVIEQLHAMGLDTVVINDGSTDDTAEVVRDYGYVALLDLPFNLGIGGAVQAGLQYASQQGYAFAVQIDGDGQHPVEEIPQLLEPLKQAQADVVIGSRYLLHDSESGAPQPKAVERNPEQGPWPASKGTTRLRAAGTRFLSLLASWILQQPITDSTSGFRAYNRRAMEFLGQWYPQDYPEPEAVVLLGRNGFRLKELPARLHSRQGGRSSINAWRSAYYMVKVTLAMVMEYFRGPLAHHGISSL